MDDGAFFDALRQPPANPEAEQALLGAILTSNRAFELVAPVLEPEHFADPIHTKIYEAIARRITAGETADAVTLKTDLEHTGILDEVGGTAYLAQLLTAMVGISIAGDYAQVVRGCWVRRRTIEAARQLIDEAHAGLPSAEAAAEVAAAVEAVSPSAGGRAARILPAADFMAGFVPPDYVVDGIIQRGRLYALTSPTGHGKTAVALYLGCNVHAGRNIGNIEVTQGAVVFLAGENPEDLRCRLYAAAQAYGVPAALLPRVLPGNFPMTAEGAKALKADIDALGCDVAMIVVDTVAAFFAGKDANDNVQMGDYGRNLRILTACRGNPAVLAPAHPVKNAGKESLLPYGGGGFLNELDGNLTLWSEAMGESATLHWQGKLRGADFAPVNFRLFQVKIADLTDRRGRPILSIVAALQTEAEAAAATKQAHTDENTVLELLRRKPGVAISEIASTAGWVSATGVPNKAKVARLLKALKNDKLATQHRGKWIITDAGKKELEGVTGKRIVDET